MNRRVPTTRMYLQAIRVVYRRLLFAMTLFLALNSRSCRFEGQLGRNLRWNLLHQFAQQAERIHGRTYTRLEYWRISDVMMTIILYEKRAPFQVLYDASEFHSVLDKAVDYLLMQHDWHR